MPVVIPVKFRYASRELWFDPRGTGAIEADHVVCRTERGLEIGIATGDPREVSHRQYRSACGDAPLKPVERIATEADLERAEMLAERGDAALPTFRRLVDASGLDIKPVGVEWVFSGEKVVCYFSAEERVDFRQLVRELGRELHERIDMRQIGVREEASVIGGYAHCGQELCCARFGRQFEPVSIRMAKEQDLPLNSTKISGVCGRLMCCLRYEFEAYRDFKSRAPKRNAVIETPLGTAKIVEYDTPKEQICLRLENGKQIRVPLGDMEASDAARQKAETLGCACRPDTVTRQALERLQSPEVQMALAELDRAAGVVAADDDPSRGGASSSGRTRRRRRSGTGATSADEAAREDATPSSEPTQGRRRRRRRSGGSEATAAAGEGAVRRQAQGEPAPDAAPSSGSKTRRRRRHHSTEAASDAGAPAQQRGQRDERETRRPRRRPGDHGGTSAEGQRQQQARGDGQQQEANGEATRRRRRRRGGGRRGGSEGGVGAGAGDAQ